MREIKGLSQRLQQLDQLLQKVRDFDESLETLAESLKKQEQSAMGTSKDFNVFSNIQQMQMETLRQMVTQYKTLWDICSRFHKAKAELLRNIRSRITWISQCQVLISNQDGKLVIFREQLIRLK